MYTLNLIIFTNRIQDVLILNKRKNNNDASLCVHMSRLNIIDATLKQDAK